MPKLRRSWRQPPMRVRHRERRRTEENTGSERSQGSGSAIASETRKYHESAPLTGVASVFYAIRCGLRPKDSTIIGPLSGGLESLPGTQGFGNGPCLGDTAPWAEGSIAVRNFTQCSQPMCMNL